MKSQELERRYKRIWKAPEKSNVGLAISFFFTLRFRKNFNSYFSKAAFDMVLHHPSSSPVASTCSSIKSFWTSRHLWGQGTFRVIKYCFSKTNVRCLALCHIDFDNSGSNFNTFNWSTNTIIIIICDNIIVYVWFRNLVFNKKLTYIYRIFILNKYLNYGN